jgi:hypothetical protein
MGVNLDPPDRAGREFMALSRREQGFNHGVCAMAAGMKLVLDVLEDEGVRRRVLPGRLAVRLVAVGTDESLIAGQPVVAGQETALGEASRLDAIGGGDPGIERRTGI